MSDIRLEEALPGFSVIDSPEHSCAVYIVSVQKGEKELPVYVGQTRNLTGRIGDYGRAGFKAATDFKVGEAIKHFRQAGFHVRIWYKRCDAPEQEEAEMQRQLQRKGCRLLNDLKGYDYKKASEEAERTRVVQFCDHLIRDFG